MWLFREQPEPRKPDALSVLGHMDPQEQSTLDLIAAQERQAGRDEVMRIMETAQSLRRVLHAGWFIIGLIIGVAFGAMT